MATSANSYLSTAASSSYVNPQIWSDAIEQIAREQRVILPMGVTDTRALGKAGVQINIAKNQAFVAAELTEGTATPVSSMAYDQVTVTFFEVGLAKQISIIELDYSIRGVFNDVTMNMGEAMGEYKESKIIDVCSAGAKNTIYTNDVTSGTIESTDTLNYNAIVSARTAVRKEKRSPKYLIVHPDQMDSLLKETKFQDASQFPSMVAIKGFVGKVAGMAVYESTFINSAEENGTTVYQALVLAERPFVYAPKRAVRMLWAEDSILDRAITFAADEAYGVSVLNDESIAVLKSA